jgi:hypothetical protein
MENLTHLSASAEALWNTLDLLTGRSQVITTLPVETRYFRIHRPNPVLLALLYSDLQGKSDCFKHLSAIIPCYEKGSPLDPPTLHPCQERAAFMRLGISIVVE